MQGFFSRLGNAWRSIVAAAKAGYSKDTGLKLPESLAKRQIPPADPKKTPQK